LAFQFRLSGKAVENKTAAQIKAPIRDALTAFGPVDEIRVANKDADKDIIVIFVNRLFERGQVLKDALDKNDKNAATLTVFDTKVELTKVEIAESSAGGAFSGTSQRKSKKPPKMAERGRGRGGKGDDEGRGGAAAGGRGGRGGAAAPAAGGKKDDKKGADKKGDKKDDKKGGDKKDDKKGGDKKAAAKK